MNRRVLLRHRSEFKVHTPDYLRRFFATIVPYVAKGKRQAPGHFAYPYEGDGVFGGVSYETPGSYEFTYRAPELGTDLHLKVTLAEMKAIASGQTSVLTLWRCSLHDCERSLDSPLATCANCDEGCARAQWSKQQIAEEKRWQRQFQRLVGGATNKAGADASLFKGPVRVVEYDEQPTFGRLVDLGREGCATKIKATNAHSGKPVRFLRLDQTARRMSGGVGGMVIEFKQDRITVGELAWELASLQVSWGTQDRLGYAPERPIHNVRDRWLSSLACGDSSCWSPICYSALEGL